MIEVPSNEAFFDIRAKDAFLFTYDIYLDVVRLHRYIPSAREPRIVRLPNYKLWFPKYFKPEKTGLASVVRSPGDETWGVGWRISSDELKAFERKLAMPNRYHAHEARFVDRGNFRMPGVTYQITVPDDPPSKPSRAYISEIIDLAKKMELPDDYIVTLASFEVLDS
ncbi:hypothetical protein J7K50_08290 [bacterium]|nr:hypothetical protein [bacterium]